MTGVWSKIKQALAMEERTQINEDLIAVGHPADIDYMKRNVFEGDRSLSVAVEEADYLSGRRKRELRSENARLVSKAAKAFEKVTFVDAKGYKVENPGFYDAKKGGMSTAAKTLVYGRKP
tara:strand:- start:2045 stop:2404 length:360 start_codon:yes stop_codon:yes gene_type:complete